MDVSLVIITLSSLKIGRYVHYIADVVKAEEKSTHYLLFVHIYETSSKLGIPPKGLQDLQYMNDNISIPLIAIGGITPENTKEIVQKGVAGIAVMSGILLSADPKETVKKYRAILDKGDK